MKFVESLAGDRQFATPVVKRSRGQDHAKELVGQLTDSGVGNFLSHIIMLREGIAKSIQVGQIKE